MMKQTGPHVYPASPTALNEVGSLVADLSRELTVGGDLQSLLERFLISIIAMAGAQAGAVRVLTDDGQSMRLVGQVGLPPLVVLSEQLVDRDCGMCGVAVSSSMWRSSSEARRSRSSKR